MLIVSISLKSEIVKMLTLSTVSVPLIPFGESSQRATIELLSRQALSPVITNSDIIAGLVYENVTVEPMVIQKLEENNTLLVFMEGEGIEKNM